MLSSRWRRAMSAAVMCAVAAAIATGCGSDEPAKDGEASSRSSDTSTETSTEETASEEAAPTSTDEVDETEESAPSSFTATIVSGQPKGGPQVWRAKKGDRVRITVTSDVADELHLHGYDVKKDVAAGGTATLELVADTTGSFELELEDSGALVGNLEVR